MAAGEGAQPQNEGSAAGDSRRLLLAGGLACLLAILIVSVVLLAGGSGDEETVSAPPAECLRAWNRDQDALSFSRHNTIAHNYDSAQVGYMDSTSSARVSDRPADGDCVVVFPRASLDPEPVAAGQLLLGRFWVPLDSLLPAAEVARLQSEAFVGVNAQPTRGGQIVPLADAGDD